MSSTLIGFRARVFPPLVFWLLASSCLSACATDNSDREILERMAAEHALCVAQYEHARSELEARTPLPQEWDFGPEGTILVREVDLVGRPGDEILKVSYTYVNTTGRPVKTARVTLTFLEPETETEWSQEMDLTLPYRFKFTRDSSYSTWFEIPTNGAHTHEGWEWSLSVESLSS